MARSPLTYAGALALLGRNERPLLDKIDKLLGGAILASTPFTGPAVWALLGPKNEAIKVTRTLLDKAKSRTLGSSGRTRHELLAAAHTVLVLSSFFDALGDEIGPAYQRFDVTHKDKLRLAGASDDAGQVGQLLDLPIPMPSASQDFDANLGELTTFYHRLTTATSSFIAGLAAAETVAAFEPAGLVGAACKRYEDAYFRFAVDVPEFGLWVAWNDAAGLRLSQNQILELLTGQSAALARLHDMLSLTAPARQSTGHHYRRLLANDAQSVLSKSLLRSKSARPPDNLKFPTVEQGFVTPHYKSKTYTKDALPTQESWWADRTRRSDLDQFLAAHLASADSTRLPLLILGDPGAGKSLLTEVIAARLPASTFTVVRVPLRNVDPTKKLHEQITGALELNQKVDWGDLTSECEDTTRVVILDGFDELLLATGVAETAYLEDVALFQEKEHDLDRPVAVIVTSRTLVADRARIPASCLMIKLEEFDDDQITAWLTAWNTANAVVAGFRPLELDELLEHDELARQPLILLFLAIYAADSGRRLDAEDLSGARLYQRLLDSFIERQVRDKSHQQLSDVEASQEQQHQRWQLSLAAFGMFNRGSQHIDASQLESDLAVFSQTSQPRVRSTFKPPIGPAEQTITGFFFLQVLDTDTDARRSYEFLHATFGEYLIAEYTMSLIGQLSAAARFPGTEPPDDDRLFALLSHQSILKQRPIIDFAIEIHQSLEPEQRQHILELLTELLWLARSHARTRKYDRYEPTPYDTVCRLANYTANLALLRIVLAEGELLLRHLAPAGSRPLEWWRSMVLLWESGLDAEAWSYIPDEFTLSYGNDPAVLTDNESDSRERLLLENEREIQILTGDELYLTDIVINAEQERQLYDNLVLANLPDAGTFPLTRLMPRHEERFKSIITGIKAGSRLSGNAPGSLWRALSCSAPYLPFDIVSELVSLLLTGQESAEGKRWPGLGCEFAAVVAAHPLLLQSNDDAAAVLADSEFPEVHVDAPLAVAILWHAERASAEPESSALRRLRMKYDVLAASASALGRRWMVPEYLTYLRTTQPTYWNIDTSALTSLIESTEILSRTAPEDALYLAAAYQPDPDGSRVLLNVFVHRYLEAHGQPVDGLTEDNAVERLREYAQVPWTRP